MNPGPVRPVGVESGVAATQKLKRGRKADSVKAGIGPSVRVDVDYSLSKSAPDNAADMEPMDNRHYNDDEIKSHIGAIFAFTEAYNALLEALEPPLSDALREAVYRPVELEHTHSRARRISLYETGVAHSPNDREAGRLSVHEKKLYVALSTRKTDVETLFIKEGGGLLDGLDNILRAFPEELTQDETIMLHINRFQGACSRLRQVMEGA